MLFQVSSSQVKPMLTLFSNHKYKTWYMVNEDIQEYISEATPHSEDDIEDECTSYCYVHHFIKRLINYLFN